MPDRVPPTEAEQRYLRLLDHLPGTLVLKSDCDLRCKFAGGGDFAEIALDRSSLLGQPLEVAYAACGDARESMLARHRAALAGETTTRITRSPHNGREYETTILPLPDDDGELIGTMLVATDVTRRLVDQRELRRLAQVVAMSAEAIMACDIAGRIVSANARACELFGCESEEQMVALPTGALTPEDEMPRLEAAMRHVRNGRPWRGEVEQVRLDGTRFWASLTMAPMHDDTGNVTGASIVLLDISDRRAAERRVREANERFSQMFDHAPIGMALVGLDGRWQHVNRALCEVTGYTERQLLGKTFQEITHPDDLESDIEQVNQLLAGTRNSYTMEKRYIRGDGTVIWVLLTVSLLRDEDGEPLHFISQVLDISDRKRIEARLRNQADVDPLTGALNRRKFSDLLSQALVNARRHRGDFALLFVDLDEFKTVNDRFGHGTGDRVLKSVAETIRNSVRATDAVGRHGGDEFVVLLEPGSPEVADTVAAKLADAIGSTVIDVSGTSIRVHASIGAACFGADAAPSPEEALAVADRLMYQAKKETGRDGA